VYYQRVEGVVFFLTKKPCSTCHNEMNKFYVWSFQ